MNTAIAFSQVRPRHRRKKLFLPDDHPEAFISISIDVPRWLNARLERDADAHRLSKAAIASEWLEMHAIATDPTRKSR